MTPKGNREEAKQRGTKTVSRPWGGDANIYPTHPILLATCNRFLGFSRKGEVEHLR